MDAEYYRIEEAARRIVNKAKKEVTASAPSVPPRCGRWNRLYGAEITETF